MTTRKLQMGILAIAFMLASSFSFAQTTTIGPTVLSCGTFGFEAISANGSIMTSGVTAANVPNLIWGGTTVASNNMVFSFRNIGGPVCSTPLVAFGQNIGGSGFQVGISGSGVVSGAWLVLSDRRIKQNIKPINDAVSLVQQLNGVSYDYNHDAAPDKGLPQGRVYGFIAQDVQKVIPEATAQLPDSDLIGVKYTEIIPLLTEAIKEQEETITALEERLAAIEEMLTNSTGSSIDNKLSDEVSKNTQLGQNRPNPFGNTTMIDYTLPENIHNASLDVFDMNGQLIQSTQITSGKGTVELDASLLSNGTYVYSINSNGKNIATKVMVVQK